ncbi:aldehyde dehydrogenase (NADP(+)) [Paracoccus sp. YLB-12]|uniref:Aldehyde dehydrogenase (NADP(+)) n=1 Tax=Paracoccus maritimus TaxID=2933292 RepID=A0ABT2K6H9_9RHOB|nr:aldehyde dehydrogenase (NADP(+)) [Paracoccus sp. YLB-12]MCT4332127.1 aldehyde dehydrogenase (NADP(+)) [Paracoccus sp. YLB-12]
MAFTPHGKHLIAGEWIAGDGHFTSRPASGPAHEFSSGTSRMVDCAARAAEDAFWTFGYTSREDRAAFLDAIADEIEARAEQITLIGTQETGLPAARLQGERGRTTGQLRLFAAHIRKGDYLDRRHDTSLPDREPLPRPDLRMIQRPIGPVAVFGASNFPLAFSTAGGDTASALAAGCPVVVKGHPAHPGTGEIVAEAIDAAIRGTGMPVGSFNFIHGDSHEVGQALVQHPLIRAVGFTGSLAGGRALFDMCAARPEPIPFFGELGSINPMFLLPNAVAARGDELARGWAGSLSMGAGQFCTNPGIAVIRADQAGEFAAATVDALRETGPQVMLSDGIAEAFAKGRDRVKGRSAVLDLLSQPCDRRQATPQLYMVEAEHWLEDQTLAEEVFGPLGLIVTAADDDQIVALAHAFEGQLTATLHLDDADAALAARLLPVLERKAGRILANGFPTGVEVSEAMVHGGPYPASTNFGATSVGTLAIRRFLRPVCFQNIPESLLQDDLRG